jgi:hypothetical protein
MAFKGARKTLTEMKKIQGKKKKWAFCTKFILFSFACSTPIFLCSAGLGSSFSETVFDNAASFAAKEAKKSPYDSVTMRATPVSEGEGTGETLRSIFVSFLNSNKYRRQYNTRLVCDYRDANGKMGPQISFSEKLQENAVFLGLTQLSDSKSDNGYKIDNTSIYTIYSSTEAAKFAGGMLGGNFVYISDILAQHFIDIGFAKELAQVPGSTISINYETIEGRRTDNFFVANIYKTTIGLGQYLVDTYQNCLINYGTQNKSWITGKSIDVDLGNSIYFNKSFIQLFISTFSKDSYSFSCFATKQNALREKNTQMLSILDELSEKKSNSLEIPKIILWLLGVLSFGILFWLLLRRWTLQNFWQGQLKPFSSSLVSLWAGITFSYLFTHALFLISLTYSTPQSWIYGFYSPISNLFSLAIFVALVVGTPLIIKNSKREEK